MDQLFQSFADQELVSPALLILQSSHILRSGGSTCLPPIKDGNKHEVSARRSSRTDDVEQQLPELVFTLLGKLVQHADSFPLASCCVHIDSNVFYLQMSALLEADESRQVLIIVLAGKRSSHPVR